MFDWEKKQRQEQLRKEFIDRINIEKQFTPYGETKTYSGKQVGTAITATGVAIPIIVPLPLAAGIGGIAAKKLEKVKVVKTDPHDKKYKIPRLQFDWK